MSEGRDTHLLRVLEHYRRFWGSVPNVLNIEQGTPAQLPEGFVVLEFAPNDDRSVWSYATCGMSQNEQYRPLELFMVSRDPLRELSSLLTTAVQYHHNVVRLDLHHRVHFGRPWVDGSECTQGFLTLPRHEDAQLEWLPAGEHGPAIRMLWMMPISESEARFAREYNPRALEQQFERNRVDFLNAHRAAVV